MRPLLTVMLVLHGLVHLLGVVAAFDLVDLGVPLEPIGPLAGLGWLLAGLLFVGAAAAVVRAPRTWWIPALAAIIVSQIVIAVSWNDARAGTVPNVAFLLAAIAAAVQARTSSFSARYAQEVGERAGRTAIAPPVTEADLARVPPAVATYLRRAGIVGRPIPHTVEATFRGRLRNGATAPWMPIEAAQHSFFDEGARLFLLRAAMRGLPFEAFHRFVGASATMEVRVAGLLDVVDARGPEMDRSETVTHFNDMCLLAPATLLDPTIRWEVLDDRRVRATYQRRKWSIAAILSFDAAGDLEGFASDDRSQTADGKTYQSATWSTVSSDPREYPGGVRLASRGRARWSGPGEPFDYARARGRRRALRRRALPTERGFACGGARREGPAHRVTRRRFFGACFALGFGGGDASFCAPNRLTYARPIRAPIEAAKVAASCPASLRWRGSAPSSTAAVAAASHSG